MWVIVSMVLSLSYFYATLGVHSQAVQTVPLTGLVISMTLLCFAGTAAGAGIP